MARRRSNQRVSSAAASSVAMRKRRNLYWTGGLGIVALSGVILAIIVSINDGGRVPDGTAGTVPNFDLTLYQGERELGASELEFASLQGQPIVLNFWAGLCPPCRAEMPGFQRFYDDMKGEVLLIGVDVGPFTNLGNSRDARNLLQELRVSYPTGFTNDRSIMRDYEVRGMPSTIFITAEGEIVQNWSGTLSEESLRALTEALLLSNEEAQEQ